MVAQAKKIKVSISAEQAQMPQTRRGSDMVPHKGGAVSSVASVL